jgi:hypothetical protein
MGLCEAGCNGFEGGRSVIIDGRKKTPIDKKDELAKMED